MSTQSDADREAYARQQTEDVLRAEAQAIHADKAKVIGKAGIELFQALNQLDSAAICLSGGGIRSAAFCLGVLQALAAHPGSAPSDNENRGRPCDKPENSLLSKFHYLSTVSGGGYIGGWLSAWRSRFPFWDPNRPQESIWNSLVFRPLGPDHEPSALSWLRSYSNYLTPRMGMLSADTWAAIALFARNLVLNWLIILPFFCIIILLLKIGAIESDGITRLDERQYVQVGFAILSLVAPPGPHQ